ncbi:MAG TPA: hypothetical protein VNM72_00895 [Blastocatellia bacterium]|nr:hypothetical protein [Blastocatellia bacterium]
MREFMILNGISAAVALISLGLAVWTVLSNKFKGGIDDLFLVLTCLFITLVFSIQPVAWLLRKWALRRASVPVKEAEKLAPEGEPEAAQKEKVAVK